MLLSKFSSLGVSALGAGPRFVVFLPLLQTQAQLTMKTITLPGLAAGIVIGLTSSLLLFSKSLPVSLDATQTQHDASVTAQPPTTDVTTSNRASSMEDNIRFFFNTAKSLNPTPDKVGPHSYHTMYGMYLLPMYASKPNMKMLEIGLGCRMQYGPGASVQLWKKLFPKAQLWEAEYDGKCVEEAKKKGQLDGLNVLVGDQG